MVSPPKGGFSSAAEGVECLVYPPICKEDRALIGV